MRVLALTLACLVVATSATGCLDELVGGGLEPEDYLRSDPYTTWIIEVDAVQGMLPSQDAFELLRSRLMEVADKPGGIEVRQSQTNLSPRGGTWSSNEILALDRETQDTRTGGQTVVTHLLFLDGQFEQPNAIGVAIGHSTIAIFSDLIRDSCTLLTCLNGTDSVFRAVLVHEFGHAMGLVDNGIRMVNDHEDPEHEGHSNNRNSVMWWQVETLDIFNVFSGGPPTTFDVNDRADMCEAGGLC